MSREIEQILKNQVVIMGMLQDLQDELEPIQNIEDTHQLLVDKNNGWIPCSERLPEIRKDVLAVVKYNGFMGMYGTWMRIGHLESDNEWLGDCIGGKVIAWQPLPEPYREELEDGRY